MTSPSIPMLFMGQELLEDKYWSENFDFHPNQFIYWDGLNNQKQMSDFYRYTKDLINMRWQLPALKSQGFSVSHTNDQGRVIAYHRWVPGEGKDVMAVIYLGNSNNYNYRIGFPIAGSWKESFNSDFYENCPNPNTIGNGGGK